MMTRMVMQRIGIGIATLWVVSVIVFVATSILPGDVAQIVQAEAALPRTSEPDNPRIVFVEDSQNAIRLALDCTQATVAGPGMSGFR